LIKYNDFVLKNYAYLALFESKYAVYYNTRIASSLEKILEVLQQIFLRDITDQEYSIYLYEIIKIGTHVIKKSAEFNDKALDKMYNFELIQKLLFSSKKAHEDGNYSTSITDFEQLLTLISDTISHNEQSRSIKVTSDKISSINMNDFSKEYDMLFQCIDLNQEINGLIRNIEDRKFPDKNETSIVSRDTAMHEIHQGFTHLTRHVNHQLLNTKEIERFKSHIKRASLDLLKLSIESMRNFFIDLDKENLSKKMTVQLSLIKSKEVSEVVSTAIPDFKARYTRLIEDYKSHIK
jgi:hypothetical protein